MPRMALVRPRGWSMHSSVCTSRQFHEAGNKRLRRIAHVIVDVECLCEYRHFGAMRRARTPRTKVLGTYLERFSFVHDLVCWFRVLWL